MTKRQQRSSRKRMQGRVKKRSTARVMRSGAVTRSPGIGDRIAKAVAGIMKQSSRGEG